MDRARPAVIPLDPERLLAWALFIPLMTSEFLLDKPVWLFLASFIVMLRVPIAIFCKATRRRRRRKSQSSKASESWMLYKARA